MQTMKPNAPSGFFAEQADDEGQDAVRPAGSGK